jgi:hypothetical protein
MLQLSIGENVHTFTMIRGEVAAVPFGVDDVGGDAMLWLGATAGSPSFMVMLFPAGCRTMRKS